VSSTEEEQMDETVFTREGLERLSQELDRLTTSGRRGIAQLLRQAVEGGASRESADYLYAREEQAQLERRIAALEERLQAARVVEPQLGNGRVDVGERVRLRDLDSGKRLEVELVGPFEADLSAGRISVASPLGKAIVGRRRGEVADVEAPIGLRRFKVVAVEAG
jgi:transcription elongation factor GreA